MINETIIIQHAEEAAFLWLLRDKAFRQPHYRLKDLAELDDRIEGHIDGLRIAEDEGWEICKQQLSNQEPGEVFTCSVLAFESGSEDRIKEVLTFEEVSPELARGIISALGWIPFHEVNEHLKQLSSSESPALKRIGIAGYAVHREIPGRPLFEALRSDVPLLRARSLRAVGELRQKDFLPEIRDNLNAADEPCRFWAAWSGALLGDRDALEVLRTFTAQSNPFQERAVQLLLRVLDAKAAAGWLSETSKNPDNARITIVGAGAAGNPVAIPWLIDQMKAPQPARVAGEAFSTITGVDIAYEGLEGGPPKKSEAGSTEDADDDDMETDVDDNLPWPDPERVRTWWDKNQRRFQSGARYLCGKPITIDSAKEVLRVGFQRQRAAAALELALRQPGKPLFEVRAPGFSQVRQFKKGSAFDT